MKRKPFYLAPVLVALLGFGGCGPVSNNSPDDAAEKQVGSIAFAVERKWIDPIDGASNSNLVLAFKPGEVEAQAAECSEDPKWECVQVRVVPRAQSSEFDGLRQAVRSTSAPPAESEIPSPNGLVLAGVNDGVAVFSSDPGVEGAIFRCWMGDTGKDGIAGCQGETLVSDFRLILTFRRDELARWSAIVAQASSLVEQLPRAHRRDGGER